MKKAVYFAAIFISGSILLGSSIIAVSNDQYSGLLGVIDFVFIFGILTLIAAIGLLFSNIKE